jgi:hypothetical protein
MARIEEINGSGILSLEEFDFQGIHEPGCRHPEINPDHHECLRMLAIALPQRSDKLGILLSPAGMEPLLELIEHE